MREKDVPQEGNATLAGARKAVYALGEDGKYRAVPSAGWKVEEAVTSMAIAEFEAQAQAALARVRAGQSAPLEYHMYRRRMDVQTLAQSTGLFRWRVRRHLRADVFPRLSPALRARYADALGMTAAELASLPPDAP
jgi:hypothetical protein